MYIFKSVSDLMKQNSTKKDTVESKTAMKVEATKPRNVMITPIKSVVKVNHPVLYHSTFRANLPSIKEFGLGARQRKNWEFSETGKICLCTDPGVAYSFCECADGVSDSKYESGIVVLAVNVADLDPSLFALDVNINGDINEVCGYYTYTGIINPNKIGCMANRSKFAGYITKVRRVPSYKE